MNNRRFIELLNLYVDQELSEKEARELEQEIAHDPDRRRVYSEYCRMQRACVRLFEQQEAPAPQIEALTQAAEAGSGAGGGTLFRVPEELDPAATRRSRSGAGWFAWGGGALAAAACVALVVVQSTKQVTEPTGRGLPVAAATLDPESGPAIAVAASEVAAEQSRPTAAESVAPASEYRPVFVVNLRPEESQFDRQAPAFALDSSSLDWMQELRLKPIRRMSADAMNFAPASANWAAQAPASLNGTRDQSAAAEMVTFTFQR